MSGKSSKILTGALFAAFVASAPLSAFAQDKVVLRTDFRFNGYVTPFALALERGYYSDAGLDVTIEQGQGSATTIQTVAAGNDTFGLADSSTLVRGVSAQDIPVKLLSVYTQTGTNGLIYHQDSGFTGELEQLRGKPMVSSPGSAELTLLPALLATAGMTMDDLELQLVDFNARVPLFLQTPDAFLSGFATGDYLRVRAEEPTAQYKPFSDYGILVHGTGLIATDDTIESNPDLVRRFVEASLKGWNDAVADPEAAVQAGIKLFPDVDATLLRDGLQIVIDQQLHTPNTEGKPIGWTAEEDWVTMLDVLKTYGEVATKEPSAYYTNEFIPQQ
jgi:NitT/TauT family transport system substrate-binding protein